MFKSGRYFATEEEYKIFKDRSNASTVKRQRMLREMAIKKLGNRCCRCGFEDHRALQFDHINGGGGDEILLSGTRNVIKRVLAGATDIQLLCANCNWIKRYENEEHNNLDREEKPSDILYRERYTRLRNGVALKVALSEIKAQKI